MGFNMIRQPLGKHSESRGHPYYVKHADRASKKTLNGVTENASSGKNWGVVPNLNTLDNRTLIIEM